MADKKDTKFRHVIWPSLLAIGLLASFVLLFDEGKYPPMIITPIIASVLSPLLGKITKSGNLKEHAFGVTLVCIPTSAFWIFGPNYFSIMLPFLVWIWQCASWPNKEHPPFRYGIWHGFGITASMFPGALLVQALV